MLHNPPLPLKNLILGLVFVLLHGPKNQLFIYLFFAALVPASTAPPQTRARGWRGEVRNAVKEQKVETSVSSFFSCGGC